MITVLVVALLVAVGVACALGGFIYGVATSADAGAVEVISGGGIMQCDDDDCDCKKVGFKN